MRSGNRGIQGRKSLKNGLTWKTAEGYSVRSNATYLERIGVCKHSIKNTQAGLSAEKMRDRLAKPPLGPIPAYNV